MEVHRLLLSYQPDEETLGHIVQMMKKKKQFVIGRRESQRVKRKNVIIVFNGAQNKIKKGKFAKWWQSN